MDVNKRQIRQTADGSPTLYVPALDEHYHSVHGAVQESMHVFIREGLHILDTSRLRIFEMGFGTGLNAYLACTETTRLKLKVRYHSLERYPLMLGEYQKLDYSPALPGFQPELYNALHACAWGLEHQLTGRFSLCKYEGDIRNYSFSGVYDLIIWDAFGPDKQPDLWSGEVFRKLSSAMAPGAVLVTYSAKGSVKRALQSAGLQVEKRPGPPGKREMIRAWKAGGHQKDHTKA